MKTALRNPIIFLFLLFIIFGVQNKLNAKHLLGGYFTYKFNPSTPLKPISYDLQLTLIRDDHSTSFDLFSAIQVYTFDTSTQQYTFIEVINGVPLDSMTNKEKEINGTHLSLELGYYNFNYSIPDANKNYYFVYQRCCMSYNVSNIFKTDTSGLSIIGEISQRSILNKNNSFNFKELPDFYCVKNNATILDLKIEDSDFNILTVTFDNILEGAGLHGTTGNPPATPRDCKAVIIETECPPPYNVIQYHLMDTLYQWDDLKLNKMDHYIQGVPKAISFNIYAIRINEYKNELLLGSSLVYLPLWVVNDWPIATDDTYKGNFKLYPNPTDQSINIVAEDEIKSVLVYNSSGELLVQVDPQTDKYHMVLDQPLGVYIVHVIFVDGVIIKKVLKI